MSYTKSRGRITIPTDANFIEGTKKYIQLWGADAIRDCDGTSLPKDSGQLAEKVYKTYFVSRGDNDFAYSHDKYMTDVALISKRCTALSHEVKIDLLDGFFSQQVRPDEDNYKKYWQVFDRTTGKIIYDWDYIGNNIVIVKNAKLYHEYTVNFFAKSLWNSTQIYNYTCNNWTITKDRDYNLLYPEVFHQVLANLDNWMKENPDVNVIRFTTFLYHFFLIYLKGDTQHLFDWYNYAMAASPKMFQLFYQEYGYEITLEDVVTGGSYASHFQIPNKAYLDFMKLVQKNVCNIMAKIIEKVHEKGKQAMMFWGDNWIGAEPYSECFKQMKLDAVVGSVSSGVTYRMVSDIPNLKYREIRLMPYFFPDTLNNDEQSTKMLLENWVTERRAIMRKPVDRIGFGGYLKLADKLPVFCKTVENLCNEFREICHNIENDSPYNYLKIAIMSYWGKEKSWMTNMFSQSASVALNAGYMGFLECLCGLPVDISFISFDDAVHGALDNYDLIINMGNYGTAFSGDKCWCNTKLVETVRSYIAHGGGFIGVGEPTSYLYQGKVFQLSDVLGVDKERDATMMFARNNQTLHSEHYILKDNKGIIDYAGGPDYIYAHDNAIILDAQPVRYGNPNVKMAVNEYGEGRSFYVSGLLYNAQNTRILLRAMLWCTHNEQNIKKACSSNVNVECNYYLNSKKYALINNTDMEQTTTFYDINGKENELTLQPNQIIWID